MERYRAWDEEIVQAARACRRESHACGGIILCPHCIRDLMNQERQRGVAVGRAEIWTRFQEIAAFSATACGDLAERVALDMDHANKDHARWYRAVKRVRKAIAAAGKPHNSRALPLTDAPKGGSDGE